MTQRSIRRAAERKANKAARKALKAQPCAVASPAGPVTAPQVSEAQFAANRANAQLAHGAVTPEGKAISSRNHTIHGLTAVPCEDFKVLPNENQAAYNQSLDAYRQQWNPANPTEHDIVSRLATHAWLRNRAIRLQNELLAQAVDLTAAEDRRDFSLYMRYYNTHARAYSKALSEIMRLRNFEASQKKNEAILERRSLETQIRFESQKQKSEIHAAKLQLLELKQEAIKQRKQPSVLADVDVVKVGSDLKVVAAE